MATPLSFLEREQLLQPSVSDASCVKSIAARIIDDLGIRNPPISAGMLASSLGVDRVVPMRGMAETGYLSVQEGNVEIGVRAGDSRPRQRFTVCHECGHILQPGFALVRQLRCTPRITASHGRTPDIERLCDLAASHLLLPPKLFAPDARRSSFSFEAIDELAGRYEASFEATAIQFVQCWAEPAAALLVFAAPNKPAEVDRLGLRLRSFTLRGRWPFLHVGRSLEDDAPIHLATQGDTVHFPMYRLAGICEPRMVELSARAMPFRDGPRMQQRVVALARPVRPGTPVARG